MAPLDRFCYFVFFTGAAFSSGFPFPGISAPCWGNLGLGLEGGRGSGGGLVEEGKPPWRERGGLGARALLLAVSWRLELRHWRDIKSTFSICPFRKFHRSQQPDPAWQVLLSLFPGTEAGKPEGVCSNGEHLQNTPCALRGAPRYSRHLQGGSPDSSLEAQVLQCHGGLRDGRKLRPRGGTCLGPHCRWKILHLDSTLGKFPRCPQAGVRNPCFLQLKSMGICLSLHLPTQL